MRTLAAMGTAVAGKVGEGKAGLGKGTGQGQRHSEEEGRHTRERTWEGARGQASRQVQGHSAVAARRQRQ